MSLITLDFETPFRSRRNKFSEGEKYTLRGMTYEEYIRDPRFRVMGVGIKADDAPTYFVRHGPGVKEALQQYFHKGNQNILLAHNTPFDAAVLSWHYGLQAHKYWDTIGMSNAIWPQQSAKLGALVRRLFPDNPKIRKSEELTGYDGYWPEDMSEEDWAIYGDKYCVNDVEITFAAFAEMWRYFPQSEFEVMDMTLKMFIDPAFVLDTARVAEYQRTLIEDKKRKVAASGISPTMLSSNPKFTVFLKENHDIDIPWIPSPTIRNPQNMKLALSKSDLEFIQIRKQHPELEHIWAARIAIKSTGEVNRCGRLLTHAHPETSAIAVPLKYYGAHCVPGDTEVLTKEGWVSLYKWQGEDIAQVKDDQTIIFAAAKKFIGPQTNIWLQSDAPYAPALYTPGHKVPFLTHGSFKWGETSAAESCVKKSFYLPIGGILETEGSLTPEQIRVLVMIQADGHFTKDNGLVINLTKPRKQVRARELLDAADVKFRELTFPSHPGEIRFALSAVDYPRWLTPDRKVFGSWLLDSTSAARIAFVEEIALWDGWINGGCQVAYGSIERKNAEWVTTLCHLVGKSASISLKKAQSNRQPFYTVQIRNRAHAMVMKKHWSLENTPRTAYCAETQTGFWLARYKGRIFITGNTGRWSGYNSVNFQNFKRGSPLRKSLYAPKGFRVLVRDLANIEGRVNAWFNEQHDKCLKFANGVDLYNEIASDIFGYPVDRKEKLVNANGEYINTEGAVVTDPDYAADKYFTEGFTGKTAELGLGYGMGPPKFRHQCAVLGDMLFEEDFAKDVVKLWRQKNYKIVAGWKTGDRAIFDMASPNITPYQWKCLEVQRNRLILPNGLALTYPSLKQTTEAGRTGFSFWEGTFYKNLYGGLLMENIIQALSRIILSTMMIQMDRKLREMGGRILLTVHDEIVGICPTPLAEEAFEYMGEVMSTPPAWANDGYLALSSSGGIDDNYSK